MLVPTVIFAMNKVYSKCPLISSYAQTRWYRNSNQPLPPGFKELCSQVEKFSGRTGDCDVELWLEDFEEASKDCGWSDKQRAQWFSWFITGPAKTTWQ